jgi:integrase/recombinase XerD
MRLRNWSEQTLRSYRVGLKQFFAYLESQGVVSLGAVSRDLIESYRTHLFYRRHRGKAISVASQHLRLQTVKSFMRYLARENYLLVDVAATVDLPKIPERLPDVLSESETLQLLEGGDVQSPLGIRDRAILEVFYATAIRNQELGSLHLDDIDREHQALWIRQGKGQKSRMVPLGDEALAWLEEYLTRVRPQLVIRANETHVFLTRRGQPLSASVLHGLVRRCGVQAGFSKRIKPHTLRHSCATHMLARGADLRHIQALLGHASPDITQNYTRVELSELHKVLRRCHPREKSTWS